MLNLSKNVIKLFSTHPVVGIKPVWILSEIFIKSVKFTMDENAKHTLNHTNGETYSS